MNSCTAASSRACCRRVSPPYESPLCIKLARKGRRGVRLALRASETETTLAFPKPPVTILLRYSSRHKGSLKWVVFASLSHDKLRTPFEDRLSAPAGDKFVNGARDAVLPETCVMVVVADYVTAGLEFAPVKL